MPRSKISGDWISCDGGKTITAVTTKLPPNPFGMVIEGSDDGYEWFVMKTLANVRFVRAGGFIFQQGKEDVMKKKAVKKPAKKGAKKSC